MIPARGQSKCGFALPVVLLGLLVLSACVPSAGETRRQTPALPGISRIALLPVLFADRAQDRSVEYRTGEEILWRARRALENKGYRVVSVGEPASRSFIRTFSPPADDPATLAALAPAEVDGVMVIRVEQFLDAALHGGGDESLGSGGGESLELHAGAELISRQDRRILWHRQGIGNATGFGAAGLHEIRVAHDLVDILLATFPERARSE